MTKIHNTYPTWDEFAEECVDVVLKRLKASHKAKTLEGKRTVSANQRKFNYKGKQRGSKNGKHDASC